MLEAVSQPEGAGPRRGVLRARPPLPRGSDADAPNPRKSPAAKKMPENPIFKSWTSQVHDEEEEVTVSLSLHASAAIRYNLLGKGC